MIKHDFGMELRLWFTRQNASVRSSSRPKKNEKFMKLKRDKKVWAEIEKSAAEFEKHMVTHEARSGFRRFDDFMRPDEKPFFDGCVPMLLEI